MLEGVGPGRVSGSRYELFRHICGTVYVPQVCLFVFWKICFGKIFLLERFFLEGFFLGGFSETGAIPGYKKTPVRPHFDKSQKGNMFSDCGAMYVT